MAGDRLERDMQHAMVGGVRAGLARRYDFDAALVRAIMVLCAVATMGAAVSVYVVAWIVMPRDDAPASTFAVATPGAAPAAPGSVTDEKRQTTARLLEVARVVAGKTREAAEEIAEIARRGPMAATPPAPPAPPSTPAPAPPAPPAPVAP